MLLPPSTACSRQAALLLSVEIGPVLPAQLAFSARLVGKCLHGGAYLPMVPAAPAPCSLPAPVFCRLPTLPAPAPSLMQGSLPAEHAAMPPNPYAEPTLPLHAGSGYEPTMTLATRNAFAAINSMFRVGELIATCTHGSMLGFHQQLLTRCRGTGPASWPVLPAARGSSACACDQDPLPQLLPLCGPPAQGSLPDEHGALPPRQGGPPAEPTVTINTRAAFDAINSMFGGGGSGGNVAAPAGGWRWVAHECWLNGRAPGGQRAQDCCCPAASRALASLRHAACS